MVTKLKKPATPTPRSKKAAAADAPSTVGLTDAVRDSAQQIWQAGLGAFTRAQTEGTKAFEALVKEGVRFQRKTQSVAEDKITEATQKMSTMASDIGARASGQWDKLESIFEDRVARALNKLGVPSAKDVQALIERIDTLAASVQALSAGQDKPAKPTRSAARKPAAAAAAAPEIAPEAAPAETPKPKRVRRTPTRKVAPNTEANPE